MSTPRMPTLFLAHGNPMNALEDNHYTQTWAALGRRLPRPQAILMISAHWCTQGTFVTAMPHPKTLHDFYGFPQELSTLHYPAPGSLDLAHHIQQLLSDLPVHADQHWGLDHGTWGVLCKMYPAADIPVVQLSLDLHQPASWHYNVGKRLKSLRDQGVMIIGSGNVVHSLRHALWQKEAPAYDWAIAFNNAVRKALPLHSSESSLINIMHLPGAALSVPTPEHYLPLLYTMGAADPNDIISVPCDGIEMGSISMMCVMAGAEPISDKA